MSSVDINWREIRPLEGNRHHGFEELCAQLAEKEAPEGSLFVRKGTPDAGVECFATLKGGTEWGWQAKYVHSLGAKQWAELDDSIRTAIDKHPKLVRYFVCVPVDRPDARVRKQKSCLQRWNDRVNKWTRWANNRKRKIEFAYWGKHELLDQLSKPEHLGRLRFWFDTRIFDDSWFSARLSESIRAAGPRYTPEIHVDLPIAREFEAFGRTNRLFDEIKAHARTIRQRIQSIEHGERSTAEPTIKNATATLSTQVEGILVALGAMKPQPTGTLSFKRIADEIAIAEAACDDVARTLAENERTHEIQVKGKAEARSFYQINPFRDRRSRFLSLSLELRSTHQALDHAQRMAGGSLMLLRGEWGTGKSHLLCDVATRRLAENRPTILLMGQRFASEEEPWAQALQHLDLDDLSAEEFVGTLEAAAQTSGSRALVMIDAINEGKGRSIWPGHLSAFLAHIERSPWIGVVLSVRSSYEKVVIPDDVLSRAADVTHEGFADHEYDATKKFFDFYGLELPSTPLLVPEFRKPLFLKTLCKGLSDNGERRLPRGFHGITAVFDLHLDAVNRVLAQPMRLDFNPKDHLVKKALEAISNALLESDEEWLPLAKAGEIVDRLLPNRGFEQSLYRGLVVEGVLIEEVPRRRDGKQEEGVRIGYERMADHLAAKTLIGRIDPNDLSSAFAKGGPLAFLSDREQRPYVSPGLLEALCVQIPEQFAQELSTLAPGVDGRWGFASAFRQSLVWRAAEACSDDTLKVLKSVDEHADDRTESLDVLLTVATLPEHRLNAGFLDRQLWRNSMPDRDAWWSTFLHRAWGTHSAVDRLVDWASSLQPGVLLDEGAVDLSALAISWMLSTSNRFLRDRATKALVCLLTGRLPAVVRLVDHFADVNDPYILERIYSVAYGTVMRCHDPGPAGQLAKCVYEHVFAAGRPPAHILLRDYARGVVERALYLGAKINVDAAKIRPPYASQWPTIPTKEDIEKLFPDKSQAGYDSGSLEWGRYRIKSSVTADDFSSYVIGTNSAATSRNWLSLRLEDPEWTPPPRPDELLNALVAEFSMTERAALDRFDSLDKAYSAIPLTTIIGSPRKRSRRESAATTAPNPRITTIRLEKKRISGLAELKRKREKALQELRTALETTHRQRFDEILALASVRESGKPPRFPLEQVQRYVLRRALELGWTEDRFGWFDRNDIGYDGGRSAAKAERIGKKYQWIAYHEILAFISDHFQYREAFRDDKDARAYDGPWQTGIRNIDPTCTLRSVVGKTGLHGHAQSWWAAARYDHWELPEKPEEWVKLTSDLPSVDDLLIVRDANGSRWANVDGYFDWSKPTPPDQEYSDTEHRDFWCSCKGYLVQKADAPIFMTWAENEDFLGGWMPDAPKVYQMYLGEHVWSRACRHFQQPYFGDDGWKQPERGCPVRIRAAGFQYSVEGRGFDCSVDDGFQLRLPAHDLVTGLGIRWSGTGADFSDADGKLAAQDPTVGVDGPNALLLREDLLRDYLSREGLALCWTVAGEKRAFPGGFDTGFRAFLRLSGAYLLGAKGPVGFLKCAQEGRGADGREAPAKVIETIRTPGVKQRAGRRRRRSCQNR